MLLVDTLAPLVLLIVLGAGLARIRFLGPAFIADLNKLAFWIALPALLFTSADSILSCEEVVGELAESRGLHAKWLERLVRGCSEATGFLARRVEAYEGRIGDFLRGHVLACALAELFARLRDVEYVVNDLEGETQVVSEPCECGDLFLCCVCGHCAELCACGNHGSRLAFVNEAQLGAGRFPSFPLQIGYLPGNELLTASGERKRGHEVLEPVTP